jgi:salicylate hydroxylase
MHTHGERAGVECQAGGEECDDVFTASATVLVGCDGIRSAVRPKKLGEDVALLRYLGCCVVLGIAASPDSILTDGETVFQTADGVTRLYAMPFAQAGEEVSTIAGGIFNRPTEHRGLSMWQLSFPMQEAESKRLSKLGPSALKAEALKRCGRWHDPIPVLLSQTPEDLITGYPCYDRATVKKVFFEQAAMHPKLPLPTLL